MEARDRPSRRPQRRLIGLSLVSLAISALVLMATLRVPIANINVQRYDNQNVILIGPSAAILPHEAILTVLSSGRQSSTFQAAVLVDGIAASGSRAEREAWWQTRDKVASSLRARPLTLILPNGKQVEARSRPRRLRDLTERFWAALLTGHAALLFGTWILVMRPRNPAARAFAITSLGLFGIGCTLAAAYDPLLLGDAYRWMMLLNHFSIQLFAAGILALFCRFPKRLFGWKTVCAIAFAAFVLTLVDLADLATDPIAVVFASIVGAFIALIILVGMQILATRGDPTSRYAIRLMAASAVISGALIVGIVVLPYLIWGAPLVSEAAALPLLLVIYAGMGVAVARTRLYPVERWGAGLFLSTCIAIGAAALDLSLLSLLTNLQGELLPIAIGGMALLYLPMRLRLTRRRAERNERSLQLASELAFTVSPADRVARWRAALIAMFDPLEVASANAVERPLVTEEGNAMHLPGVGDLPPMVLRYAGRGGRDFDRTDAKQAEEIIGVVATLIGARDSYILGVAKERQRIARDLHDDVSALLLTSLHRQDQATMRDDIREAMADIRSIVAGTSGSARLLDDVLADLRFEMASRLEAVGTKLTWPVHASTGALIPHDAARHIASILRETTSNIIRHAEAKAVHVTIEIADGFLLRVCDDGMGIPQSCLPGNGLENCSLRATQLGATFTVSSGRTGSTVELSISAENFEALRASF